MFEKAERDLPRAVIRRATAVLVLLYLISFVTPALCFDRAVSGCERSIPGYLAALGSLAVVGEWFTQRTGETSVLDIIESLPSPLQPPASWSRALIFRTLCSTS